MSMKFTINRVVNPEKRGKTFAKKADCANFPLFERIFDVAGDGIQSIFCVNNFFTITQNGRLDWGQAMGKIEEIVQAHFREAKPGEPQASRGDHPGDATPGA
jgi:hypothetical protein